MIKFIPKKQRDKSWPSNALLTIAALFGLVLLIIVVAIGAMFLISIYNLFI